MNCQKFFYSTLVATKHLTVRILMSNRGISQRNKFTFFIKDVVINHVGLSFIIEMKEKIHFEVNEQCV